MQIGSTVFKPTGRRKGCEQKNKLSKFNEHRLSEVRYGHTIVPMAIWFATGV